MTQEKQQPTGQTQQKGIPSQKESQKESQKDQTTGQAPQSQKGQSAQGKDGQRDKAQNQRDQTTGQGQRDQTQSPSQQAPTQAQPPQRQQGQTGQTGQKAQPSQQGQTTTQQGQSGQATTGQASSSVTLTSEQRTRIKETILVSGNAPRASNVNFNLAVGTVVPTAVRVVEVPQVIIEIHPEWRGFWYFVVNDEIIIVDRDHKIVAVLVV